MDNSKEYEHGSYVGNTSQFCLRHQHPSAGPPTKPAETGRCQRAGITKYRKILDIGNVSVRRAEEGGRDRREGGGSLLLWMVLPEESTKG